VDIWVADVHALADQVQKYAGFLSAEEVGRSARFRDPLNRNRYVVRHGMVRAVLSRYAHSDPAQVEIQYGSNGKPHLKKGSNGSGLQFSTSHSGHLNLVAIGRTAKIGVDIEKISEFPEVREIADRHFTAAEVRELDCSPESRRFEVFFKLWTRKEAVLKANGRGLTLPLDCVDVSTQCGGSGAWSVQIRQGATEGEFCLTDLKVAPGFAAALAVTTSVNQLNIVCRAYPSC